jgi:hypothetical protein
VYWRLAFNVHLCTTCIHSIHGDQKNALDPPPPRTAVIDSCKLPCQCWESNPAPLGEQPVRVTAEPSPIAALKFLKCRTWMSVKPLVKSLSLPHICLQNQAGSHILYSIIIIEKVHGSPGMVQRSRYADSLWSLSGSDVLLFPCLIACSL